MKAVAPTCTILGGTNGSGKSSLYDRLRPPGEFVNADLIAKQINPTRPENASLAAGKQVLRHLEQLVLAESNFVYETTLSGQQPLELMKAAKRKGYRVALAFVVLASVELNIARVAQRVANGGHDVPEAIIRRRYANSFARLPEALRLADDAAIFDNTSPSADILIRSSAGTIVENKLSSTTPTHVLLANVLHEVFGLENS